jgi:mono/diheme cytochrome c family protein
MPSRAIRALFILLGVSLPCTAGGCSGADASTSGDDATTDSPGGVSDFALTPATLYSAYVEGKTFMVPVKAAVAIERWSASDKTAVEIVSTGPMSAMIEVRKAVKSVRISATAKDGSIGTADLKITEGTLQDWEIGSKRYNQAGPPFISPEDLDEDARMRYEEDIADADRRGIPREAVTWSKYASCAFCHGDLGTYAGGAPVRHTPEQIGGYPDHQVLDIIELGEKPAGARTSNRLGSPERWMWLHTWLLRERERDGIVLYLRSLTPKAQEPYNDAPSES